MMTFKKLLALAFDEKSILYLSNLNKIYALNTENYNLIKIFSFKSDVFTIISSFSSVLRRLFRKDIRIALKIDETSLILVRDNQIHRLDLKHNQIRSCVKLPNGSRPLNIIKVDSLIEFTDGIYFGEYFSNPLKKSVKIFRYTKEDTLQEVYKFKSGEINHIHNLVVDHHRSCIWLLAGDTDDSAAIYQIKNNFKTVTRVVYGKQEYRSCVLFPIKEGLLYATDSQFQSNSIRLLKHENGEWMSLHISDINGPCIFGTQIENTFFFSTSVEGLNSGNIIKVLLRNKPGPGIRRNQSEIICGNLQDGFKTIYSNKKDIFPYVLFQFGNIIFPSGNNLTNKLFFTNIALKKNDFSTNIMKYEI